MPFASGKIFVYDNRLSKLPVYEDFFSSRSLQMFGTDNIYQLSQYAEEITPEIMIFNLNDNPEETVFAIRNLTEQKMNDYPIIILNPHNVPFTPSPEISHYFKAPLNAQKIIDTIESYCIGFKRHQILLLDSLSEEQTYLAKQLEERQYNYFEVHNGQAANRYLQKNNPKFVCIEYNIPFIIERHNLEHDRIIYVDRHQDLAEIEQFLH